MMGGRAQRSCTRVPGGRINHTSGGVGASQQSSTRPMEDGDMDDLAPGVAVLFRSRSSYRPCSGLHPLLNICEESTSENEDERESMGSRAPGTETTVLSDTPHTPLAVLCQIQRYKAWKVHCGSWDPLLTSRLLEQGQVHQEMAMLGTFLHRSPPIDGSQGSPEMVMGQGATSDLTYLIDDEAEGIVCLHRAQDEASVNDMPSVVRYILETTTRLIQEMGEHVKY